MRLCRAILTLFLLCASSAAFAQYPHGPPSPVPALPDSVRQTPYTLSGSACGLGCPVVFQLYGDSTDFQNWVEVWLNGVRVQYNDPTYGWTLASPSGSFATIPRPITDAYLTFNNAQTGTVVIVGARRPRRTVEFPESAGVPARAQNQAYNDLYAISRETWDKINDVTGRGIFFAPGNATGPMPAPSVCANAILGLDGTGLNPLCEHLVLSGTLTTPATTTNNDFATFNSTNGRSLGDSGVSAGSQAANLFLATPGGGAGAPLFRAIAAADLPPGAGTYVASSVAAFNATGNCSADDTAAFQNAINAAGAAGGSGIVYVPPVASGKCYLVSKLNITGLSGIAIVGNGDDSLIKVTGSDAQGNWLDLSGTNGPNLQNLKIISDGTHIPSILIAWMCTGTSCAASGVLSGLVIDHVNISAATSIDIFYGYGFNSVFGRASGACAIDNSTWVQTNNGSSNSNASLRNSVIQLNATNTLNIRSANQTITSSAASTLGCTAKNTNFIDAPSGFGGGTIDNNATFICNTCGQFTMYGGSIQSLNRSDAVLWNNTEDLAFYGTAFANSDGSGNTTFNWFDIGGGANAILKLDGVFFSQPATNGTFIGFDSPVAGVAGISYLNVDGPDVGANANGAPFIGLISGASCTGTTGNFITTSRIQLLTGANNITACDTIDSTTVLQNPGTVTMVAGSDNSHHQ